MIDEKQNEDSLITLRIKRRDVQFILNTLSNMPYVQVAGLIGQIMSQVQNPITPPASVYTPGRTSAVKKPAASKAELTHNTD